MLKIISIFSMICFVVACDDTKRSEIYNENNTTVIDGVVYNIAEEPIEGIYKVYYSNGNTRMEVESSGGKPDGVGTFYAEDGNVLYKVNFKKGVIDGKMQNFYKNSQIHNEMNYKEGKLDGIQKTFDKDGNLSVSITFSEGKAVSGYAVIEGEKINFTDQELSQIK